MRSKLNASLVLSFAGLFAVATACGDDGGSTPGGGDAGESGAGSGSGGSMSTGGSKGGGTAGKATNEGGDPSGGGGRPSGSAGEPSGDAGQATSMGGQGTGDGGEGGKPSGDGGEPSGTAGEPSGEAGAGGSGSVECTAVTLAAFGQAETTVDYALYAAAMTPNIFGANTDLLRLSFVSDPFDGAAIGTFDLTENGDENYKTCARCFTATADGGNGQIVFYASEGTVEIEAGSKQLGGTISAQVTNLKLVQVTIANDYTSTPVPGGACITIASAEIEVVGPACTGFECDNGYCLEDAELTCNRDPDCADQSDEEPVNETCPVWVCPESYYWDGDCDCGCGAPDPMCTSTTDPTECDYCSECQNNLDPCVDANVDPADTTMCQ
jgi:hypothetical protein